MKFADDAKVFSKVNTGGDQQHLHNDLDKLVKWLKNGRCYSILGKVNAYILGLIRINITYKEKVNYTSV